MGNAKLLRPRLIGERRKYEIRQRERRTYCSARALLSAWFARTMNNHLRVNAIVVNLDDPTMGFTSDKTPCEVTTRTHTHFRAFGIFNDVRQTSCGFHFRKKTLSFCRRSEAALLLKQCTKRVNRE